MAIDGDHYGGAIGNSLLEHLQSILHIDPLIDEVGFVHPTQLASLQMQMPTQMGVLGDATAVPDNICLQFYWNKDDHKLAISSAILLPLYRAALHAYRTTAAAMLWNPTGEWGHHLDMDMDGAMMRHSMVVLILNTNFLTPWNSRKKILSRKSRRSLFLDELQLSKLVLSYSPKSECAWSHRRWTIKIIAEKFQDLQTIVQNESELVTKIAENTKMNYRAWSHRCWLVDYFSREQVIDELRKSSKWAELHVADNCCFHYRRKLLLRLLQDGSTKPAAEHSLDKQGLFLIIKDEFAWNQLLIERYLGREALWMHRRFLLQIWTKHFMSIQTPPHDLPTENVLNEFLTSELQLARRFLGMPLDTFEDTHAQAHFAAAYIFWISKNSGLHLESGTKDDAMDALTRTCPHKSLFWKQMLN